VHYKYYITYLLTLTLTLTIRHFVTGTKVSGHFGPIVSVLKYLGAKESGHQVVWPSVLTCSTGTREINAVRRLHDSQNFIIGLGLFVIHASSNLDHLDVNAWGWLYLRGRSAYLFSSAVIGQT